MDIKIKPAPVRLDLSDPALHVGKIRRVVLTPPPPISPPPARPEPEPEQKKEKNGFLGKKTIVVVIVSVVLTTLGIRASDKFFTANINEAAKGDKCPAEMVFVVSELGGFCLDKYENSASDKCDFNNPNNQTETKKNLDDPDCKPIAIAGKVPWRNISQNQAAAACAKAGKRLPTNKEWYQAALGTVDLDGGWTKDDCNVSKNWAELPGAAGMASKCLSPSGAYDMIGNAWEWTNDTISDGKFGGRDLPDEGFIMGVDTDGLPSETGFANPDPNYNKDYFWIIKEGTRAIMRGGYWDNKTDAGYYSAYIVSPPSYSGIGVGFRCVK